jgi:peroxiredoxin
MLILLSLFALGPAASSQAGPPKVGDSAPDFALPDQSGATVRLSAFRGKNRVVLAFYIKAFTPT